MSKNLPESLNPISIPVIISQQNGAPFIQLRKTWKIIPENISIVKLILSSSFHEMPLIIYPMFYDKIKNIASLCEKGILYRNKETGEYEYNI